jgi:hypothetical protein
VDTAALRALVEKATKGRWHLNRHQRGHYFGNITSDLSEIGFPNGIRTIGLILKYAPEDEQATNAALWIAAHEDLPALLDEVEALRAALGKVSNQFRFYEREHLARARQVAGTVEETNRTIKAEANRQFADMCDAALGRSTP